MDAPPKPGFWKRQFTGRPTGRQNAYDVLVGILLPLICLYADPVVFTSHLFPALKYYRWVAYAFIGSEIAVLSLWLTLRDRVGNRALYFSGPLFAGALFALSLHAVMLPITLVGMIMIIGVLGFSPFLTAIAYLRNGIRALNHGQDRLSWGWRSMVILAGIALMLLPPIVVLRIHHDESVPDMVRAVLNHQIPSPAFQMRD